MVAGDSGLLVSTRYDVLVRSCCQRLRKAVCDYARNHCFSAPRDFRLSIFDQLRDFTLFRRRNYGSLAEAEIEAEGQGIEEVFGKIEPTFALGIILEVAVPATRFCEFHGVVRYMQGR